MSKNTHQSIERWWGDFPFQTGEQLQLGCADLLLNLACQPHQWWLGYNWQTHLNLIEPETGYFSEAIETDAFDHQHRFVFANLPDKVQLKPALADRPVVCRPVVTVSILPQQQVSLFVCLPLWLQVWSEQSEIALMEIPTVKVCDTWFGPNSREGNISYASQVSEQLDVKPISNNKARAAIEVIIHNQSAEILTLDKISVPAPNLALYADEKGQLWTPRLSLIRRENDDVTMSIDDKMSCGLNRSKLVHVAEPREDLGRNKITKAISALFG